MILASFITLFGSLITFGLVPESKFFFTCLMAYSEQVTLSYTKLTVPQAPEPNRLLTKYLFVIVDGYEIPSFGAKSLNT